MNMNVIGMKKRGHKFVRQKRGLRATGMGERKGRNVCKIIYSQKVNVKTKGKTLFFCGIEY